MTVYAHTSFDAEALKKVPLTVKITKDIAWWLALRDCLTETRYPENDLRAAIKDAITQIEQSLAKCGAGRAEDE